MKTCTTVLLAFLATTAATACSSSSDNSDPEAAGGGGAVAGSGGAAAGGTANSGGNTSGGYWGVGGNTGSGGMVSAGGTAPTGGSSASGGAPPTGGSSTSGGVLNTGGANTGGISTGGANTGGASTGGASTGGTNTGGTSTGGTSTGGTSTGGTSTGGTSTGGTTTGGSPPFDPCPTDSPCKIMPLGDSITDGTGFSGGYRVELFAHAIADNKNITFVGSLANGPDTVSGVSFPKSHEGHFAWTISQVDEIVPDPTLDPAPHIILLHLGTNDIGQGDGDAAPARLASLIDQIVERLPESLVAVAQVIPRPEWASATDSFNAAIPGIVQERIDEGQHLILVDQFSGFPTSELGDGVHPNEAGYARMAGVWYDAIQSYLH